MISVCMAVFNGEAYLGEQLRSILTQLGADDEVIIVDDCSRDGSVKIIGAFRDSRIRLVANVTNCGPVLSFQRAMTMAKGQYIFLSDQDDVWRSDKVNVIRRIFESTGSIVVISDARIVDTGRNTLSESLFSLRGSGPGFWRNLYKNGFVGCCMALRADARTFLMPFPVSGGLHDEWIGLCSSLAGPVSFSNQKLIEYRRHGGNVSKLGHGSVLSMARKRVKLLTLILRRLPRILLWRSANGRLTVPDRG